MHLFSVRIDEIMSDDNKKLLFAGLVCAIETIQQYGINISRKITSRNNELFVTYSYPSSQNQYFDNLWRYWDEMIYITDRKDHWSDSEIDELETKFKDMIAGEHDVSFEPKKADDM